MRTYEADATLNDVLSDINSEASNAAGVNFQLVLSYSNQVLVIEDGDKKLNELGISNRSSVKVVPVSFRNNYVLLSLVFYVRNDTIFIAGVSSRTSICLLCVKPQSYILESIT